jgi:hypothetical protein
MGWVSLGSIQKGVHVLVVSWHSTGHLRDECARDGSRAVKGFAPWRTHAKSGGTLADGIRWLAWPQSCTATTTCPRKPGALSGRDREVVDLRQLVLSDHGRLVTLTGVGGCGKTRLALAVASSLIGSFKDGVWLVELAALADPLLVPQAVASIFGVRERSDRSLLDALVAFLARRQVLLVLDNCEHLVKVCAELADTLLHGCPGVRRLATSREPLQIAGRLRANEPGGYPRWPSPIRVRSCVPMSSRGFRRRSCSSSALRRSSRTLA